MATPITPQEFIAKWKRTNLSERSAAQRHFLDLCERLAQPKPADDEMPGLYAACDSLVHPSRGEEFGLPIAEAMACGLPVVVTAGGAADDFCDDRTAYRIPARPASQSTLAKFDPCQTRGDPCKRQTDGWGA
jgi:glycosyltransferase involved in cell wall biosynthesis